MTPEFIAKLAATLDTNTLKHVLDLDMYWPGQEDGEMSEAEQLDSALGALVDNLQDMDDESRCEVYESIIWSLATIIQKTK